MTMPLRVGDSLRIISEAKPEQRAWCAGFFDGEGSMSTYTSRKIIRLRLTVSQVDPRVLEKFLGCVGVGGISGPKAPQGFGRKPWYRYQASGTRAIHVVEYMWPYLSEVKREQYNRNMSKTSVL